MKRFNRSAKPVQIDSPFSCPFCGHKAIVNFTLKLNTQIPSWQVACTNCGVQTRYYDDVVATEGESGAYVKQSGRDRAIAIWNTRQDKEGIDENGTDFI